MSATRDKITLIEGGKGGRGKRRGGGGSDSGTPQAGDWLDALTRNRDQRVESNAHNLLLIYEHDVHLAGLFVLDEFANRVTLVRDPPWPGGTRDEFADLDGTELAAWLGAPTRYTLSAKRDLVMDCVEASARRRARHPVRDYLDGLVWDGQPRVERMFADLFGADDTPYVRASARCFMVSAVARILWFDPLVRHNGAQVDFMLILEGEQGKGKTSAVRALFGPQWYAEAMESPAGKDFYQSLQGRWCVEIGEMDSFSKADVTKVKQAITSRFDTYRASYGRVARSYRRQCVFVGTTNDNEYLRDSTGGRRFLPVRIRDVDMAGVHARRDQLWAEAVQLFRDGCKWWELPPEAAEQQEDRFAADTWEEVIGPWLESKAGEKAYPPRINALVTAAKPVEWVTSTEILEWALRIDVGKHGRPEQTRIGPIMRRLGWEHWRPYVDGKRQRRWRPKPKEGNDDVPF